MLFKQLYKKPFVTELKQTLVDIKFLPLNFHSIIYLIVNNAIF